ncbi:ATP-binding protein (plasmid) [Roseobacteraceae bacterium NS-SX3]
MTGPAFIRKIKLPLAFIAAGIALLIALFLVITQRLHDLREARADNLTWTLSQVEVDVLLLAAEVNEARYADAYRYTALRRRFDNAYSRVDNILHSPVFAVMRGDGGFSTQLSRLHGDLEALAELIDSPDPVLAAHLTGVKRMADRIITDTRQLSVAGIKLHAEASGAERASLVRLLYAVEIISGVVILLFAATLLFILRQSRQKEAASQAEIAANARLKSSFDVSLDAIVVADADGRILEVNAAAEEVFGYSREEAAGALMADLIVPPQHRAAHLAGMERYTRTGEAKLVGRGRIEISALRKSGEEFPVEISIGQAGDASKPIFIAHMRDITARLEAERALTRARDEALQAEQAKSNFLAVMSHEMRTPLNGILGALDLLRSTPLDAGQARYLDIVQRSGDILLYHVNNVLDVTRLAAGKLELANEVFDLAAFLGDAVAANQPAAAAGGNELRLDMDPSCRRFINADAHRLRQVLYNLLSNALKFTKDGHVLVRAAAAPDGVLEFSVSDTGAGIAAKDRERIFERFFTQAASYDRVASGAGLGLAICKQLLNLMGGEISVESAVGKGSCFRVRVPVGLAAAPVCPPAQEQPAPTAAQGLAGHRILLAEDNEINRTIVRQMLAGQGAEVAEARDGREAVEMASAGRFSAILMDISMPVMNGVDAARAIRRESCNRETPILAFTAHALKEEQERFVAAGMNRCVNKPVSRAELTAALAAVIAQDDPASSGCTRSSGGEPGQPGLVNGETVRELKEVFGGGGIGRMLGKFELEIDQLFEEASGLAEAGRFGDLASAVHKAAGSSGLIGAPPLQAALHRWQQAAQASAAEEAAAQQKEAARLWHATRPALRDALCGGYANG